MGQKQSAILWFPSERDGVDVKWISENGTALKRFAEEAPHSERLIAVPRSAAIIDTEKISQKMDACVGQDSWCFVDRTPEAMLPDLIRLIKIRRHFVVMAESLNELVIVGDWSWSDWLDAHHRTVTEISVPAWRECPMSNVPPIVPVTRLPSTVWLFDLGALAMLNVIRGAAKIQRIAEDAELCDGFGARTARWNGGCVLAPDPPGCLELAEFRGPYFDPNVCPPLPAPCFPLPPSSSSPPPSRFAFAFRTHLWNTTMETLVTEYRDRLADSEYDLVVQVNVPEPNETLERARQWCNKNRIEFCHFTDRQVRSEYPFYGDAWRQSQVSFTFFLRSMMEKERSGSWRAVWFVEYDVRWSGRNIIDLLRWHDRTGSHWCPDKRHLLGTHTERFDEQPDWLRWYDYPQDLRRVIRLEEQWKYFAPLTRLSLQAIRYMDEFMTASHTHHNVEIWVPGVIAFGFGHSALANFDRRFWNAETMRYRPIHAPDTDSFLALPELQPDHLYHPIK